MSFKEQAKALLVANLDRCPEMIVAKQFKQLILDTLASSTGDPCDIIDLELETPLTDETMQCMKLCIKSELGVDVIVGNYQLRFQPSVLFN
jgi:hypothetical protein